MTSLVYLTFLSSYSFRCKSLCSQLVLDSLTRAPVLRLQVWKITQASMDIAQVHLLRSSGSRLAERPKAFRAVTSPYLGWRRPSNQRHVPSPAAPRPPSPFPFSRPLPFSNDPQESPASQYLSPPQIDSDTDDSPFIPRADLPTSLDLHATRARRQGNRPPDHSRTIDGKLTDRQIGGLCSIDEGVTCPSNTSIRKRRYIKRDGDDSPECKETDLIHPESWYNSNQSEEESLKNRSKTSSASSSLENSRVPRNQGPSADKHGPGLLTFVMSEAKTRRGSFVGSNMIPSQSIATACITGSSACTKHDRSPTDPHLATRSAGVQACSKARAPSNKTRRRNRHRRDLSDDTPAKITLRKTSEQYRCDPSKAKLRSLQNAAGRNAGADREVKFPIDALLNSYDDAKPTICGGPKLVSISSKRMDYVKSPSNPFHAPGLTAILSNEIHGGPAPRRRNSAAAGPALTYPEIYTAPRTFTICSTSRKHSAITTDRIRKTSFAQIRSGGSIHEIIWAQDDTPSSLSSNSHNTPGHSVPNSRRVSSAEAKSPGPSPPDISPVEAVVLEPDS